MNETTIVDRADERERVRAAFAGGGSVMYNGKIISRREDLADDHPARWDDDEINRLEAAMRSAGSDALTMTRIVELESWLKQRNATIDALQATNGQLSAALEAVRDERDGAVDNLNAMQAKVDATPAAPLEGALVKVALPALTPPAPPTAPTNQAQAPIVTPLPPTAPTPPVAATIAPSDNPSETALPLDFPKRQDLITGGISTVEALKAYPAGDLTKIAGIGAAAATAITERLATL